LNHFKETHFFLTLQKLISIPLKAKSKLFSFLLMLSISAIAQDDSIRIRRDPPKTRFLDKVYFGGNVGLQFGSATFLAISPLVGYKISPKLSAGVGITYQYYHYKDKYYDIQSNVYGARVFGRYMITDYLFGHVEYEYLNLEEYNFLPKRRVDVGSLLAGGGYMQRLGPRSAMVAMILYNFTESYYTPYQNPIIRIGMNFGF
jgi:hypothetical protein